MYVLIIESQLKGEVLALVEGTLGAWEVDVPEAKVVIGELNFHFMSIFLNAFVFFLKSFAHTLSHDSD